MRRVGLKWTSVGRVGSKSSPRPSRGFVSSPWWPTIERLHQAAPAPRGSLKHDGSSDADAAWPGLTVGHGEGQPGARGFSRRRAQEGVAEPAIRLSPLPSQPAAHRLVLGPQLKGRQAKRFLMVGLAILLVLFGLKAAMVRHGMRRPGAHVHSTCTCTAPASTLRLHCACTWPAATAAAPQPPHCL